MHIFALTKPLFWGWWVNNLIGILRQNEPFSSPSREVGKGLLPKGKGVYERYHSATSNLASLNHFTEVMQRKASAWVDYISAIPYYIKGVAREYSRLAWAGCVAYP